MTVLNNKVTIGSGRPVPAGPGAPLGWAARSTLCADRPGASLRGMSVPPASSTPAELSSGLVPSCMENCNITVSYRTGGWVPSLPQSTAVTPPRMECSPLHRAYEDRHSLAATPCSPGSGPHQGSGICAISLPPSHLLSARCRKTPRRVQRKVQTLGLLEPSLGSPMKGNQDAQAQKGW